MQTIGSLPISCRFEQKVTSFQCFQEHLNLARSSIYLDRDQFGLASYYVRSRRRRSNEMTIVKLSEATEALKLNISPVRSIE